MILDVAHKLVQVKNSLIKNDPVDIVFWIITKIKEVLVLKKNKFIIEIGIEHKKNVDRVRNIFESFDFKFELLKEEKEQMYYSICWGE